MEKGRLPEAVLERLTNALQDPEAAIVLIPIDFTIASAVRRITRNAIPDMPDRIIAATALHLNLPLVTRDQKIQAAGITTIW